MMKAKENTHNTGLKVSVLIFVGIAVLLGALSLSYFSLPVVMSTVYSSSVTEDVISEIIPPKPIVDTSKLVIHLPAPENVRSIYMSQCVVGTPSFRKDLVKIAETTEVNSIIIDIKDYTGKIAFETDNPVLADSVSDECGAYDMKDFVRSLNEKGIYVIGRITVFQDPYYTKALPHLAVKKASATSTLWADYKGLNFIDVGATEFHDYIIELAKESFKIGFDELNFDYIRFPSDGNMRDIYYPFSEEFVNSNPDTGKAEVVEKFFAYLNSELKSFSVKSLSSDGEIIDASPITSADLFGMVTTNTDDLNIGQQLERALPYFDYIAPMTYPSHYPPGFNGYANPNNNVYGVLKFSMDEAVKRAIASTTPVKTLNNERIGTSTPAIYTKPVYDKNKLRPWLQDFDYGGDYDIPEVRAQIQATYDSGLNSWMLWAPSNRYTQGALEPNYVDPTTMPKVVEEIVEEEVEEANASTTTQVN